MVGVEYWKENLNLKACLVKYVEERMQRTEILYFMQRLSKLQVEFTIT